MKKCQCAVLSTCFIHFGAGVIQSVVAFVLIHFRTVFIVATCDVFSAVGNISVGVVLYVVRNKDAIEDDEINRPEKKTSTCVLLLISCLVNIVSLVWLTVSDGMSMDFKVSMEGTLASTSNKQDPVLLYAYAASIASPAVLLFCLMTVCLKLQFCRTVKSKGSEDTEANVVSVSINLTPKFVEKASQTAIRNAEFRTTSFITHSMLSRDLFCPIKSYSHPALTMTDKSKSSTKELSCSIDACYPKKVKTKQLLHQDSLINLSSLELMARQERMLATYKQIKKLHKSTLSNPE